MFLGEKKGSCKGFLKAEFVFFTGFLYGFPGLLNIYKGWIQNHTEATRETTPPKSPPWCSAVFYSKALGNTLKHLLTLKKHINESFPKSNGTGRHGNKKDGINNSFEKKHLMSVGTIWWKKKNFSQETWISQNLRYSVFCTIGYAGLQGAQSMIGLISNLKYIWDTPNYNEQ